MVVQCSTGVALNCDAMNLGENDGAHVWIEQFLQNLIQ
jgi:hypothetical protein